MSSIQSRFRRRIRTILYQDQRFSNAELDLLHTPSLQRLYDLRQLGYADRVFIDASHTRLAHVVGVMEIATRIVTAILRNLSHDGQKRGQLFWGLSGRRESTTCAKLSVHLKRRLEAIRLIALLHDLTHAPFGHTLEDEIELVDPSHDAPIRQAEAFLALLVEYLAWTAVETLPERISARFSKKLDFQRLLSGQGFISDINDNDVVILGVALLHNTEARFGRTRLSPAELARLLIDLNFSTRALCHLEISHKFGPIDNSLNPQTQNYRVNKLIENILRASTKNPTARQWVVDDSCYKERAVTHPCCFDPRRDAYALDIIGNTICADLLDYALRDATQSGLPLSFDVPRIIEHYTIISYTEPEAKPEHPFSGACLRAAVDFSHGKFRGDLIGELIELLQVRYYVYERMLFHPTKCVAGAMLGRAIQLLGFKEIPSQWQRMGDAVFVHQMQEVATLALSAISDVVSQQAADESRTITGGAAVTERRYFPDVAGQLVRSLPHLPLTAVGTTKDLLLQRVTKIKDLRDDYCTKQGALWIARFLQARGLLSHDRLKAIETLSEILKDSRWKDHEAITVATLNQLCEAVARRLGDATGEGGIEGNSSVKHEIASLVPTIAAVMSEIDASRKLVARLSARRYAKRIFCLMPSNIAARDISLDRSRIADRFLDPRIRTAAERAIEHVAKLHLGSVVIHCPPSEGPIKAAKALVTYVPPKQHTIGLNNMTSSARAPEDDYESRRITQELRHIGTIAGPAGKLFAAHERHVQSLEDMYASMWRLWVAVTPPVDKEYERLSEIISSVMSAVVFAGGPYAAIDNDAFMIEELQQTYGSVPDGAGPKPDSAMTPTTQAPPKVVMAAAEHALSRTQILEILGPYLATFARSKRKRLNQRLTELRIVDRLIEQSKQPEISRYLARTRLNVDLTAPSWDARDIDNFLKGIDFLVGSTMENPLLEAQVPYRRLSRDERDAEVSLRQCVAREIALANVISSSGAIRVSKLALDKGIRVLFQPLLTSGLYALSGQHHVIFVNCGSYDLEWLTTIFMSGEQSELLPPEIRFTLAHELVHYFISTSSESTLQKARDDERVHDIAERICQGLAGELLLPESVLASLFTVAKPTAETIKRACLRLGVHPRPLVIRLEGSETFRDSTTGFSVLYCQCIGNRRVRAVQATSNIAMSGPIQTLRDIDLNNELPFEDLISGSGLDGAAETKEILASSTDAHQRATVKISMTDWANGSLHNWRIAVVERLTR